MPWYVFPYRDFSPQAPYATAVACCGSESRGKESWYLSANFFCAFGSSGLMPTAAIPRLFRSGMASRMLQAWVVQPGVSALG